MSLYITIKIIHILSVMFFIGVVGFRSFIFPVLKNKLDKHSYLQCEKAVGIRARGIIKVNNIFLILSGLFLFSYHLEVINPLVHLKVTLGLLLALTFYIVPFIMKRFQAISWFHTAFHHTFFLALVLTVVLSQIMFI